MEKNVDASNQFKVQILKEAQCYLVPITNVGRPSRLLELLAHDVDEEGKSLKY